ncbi:MAG: biopolymer transporter ExbD [Deltaproteobacteria bacterium]|nr:biopolymer transporter ExbD [Deltaproteobacteria bacterium]
MAGGGGEGGSEYEVNVNLTAMLDVLTNLLFFLMFGLAAQQTAIENEGGVQLPTSKAELPPKKATNVAIGQRELRVDKEVVMTIKNGRLGKDASGTGRIEPLYRKLVAVKGRKVASSRKAANQEDEDVLMVLCDKSIPYTLVRRVLLTSAEAGYPRFRMAALME